MAQTVAVEGLHEFVRAVSRVDKEAVRALRKELRTGIGGAVVREVKASVEAVGLVGKAAKPGYRPGGLRASIRPAVRGSTLLVRSSPPLRPGRRSPMGYAAIYEYGGRGGGEGVGPRAFMEPVARDWQESGRAEEAFAGFLDWIERTYGA